MNTQASNGAPPKPDLKLTPLDDLAKVTLTAVYLVQKHQMASLEEIIQLGREKVAAEIDPHTLERALRGAGKRGLIATERKKIAGKGSVKVFSLKTLVWKQPPEYAHITDLLPELHRNVQTEKIKQYFDGLEVKGEKKKRRGNDIDDYVTFRVQGVTLTPLLGSQISSPYLDAIREKFPNELVKSGTEVDGLWERDELTGDYVLASDILQGWWASNVTRYAGLQDAKAGYIAFVPIRFPAHTKVFQYVLPVNSSRSGPAAPKPYEALPAGLHFTMTFMTPTKGVMSPEQIEKVLMNASLRPRRGLSPARGRRFGKFMITGFECLGALKAPGTDMSSLLQDVPKDLLETYGDYLKSAVERLKSVDLASAAAASTSASEDAPASEDDDED